MPGYTLPLAVIGAFTASTVVLVMVAIGAAMRARGSSVRTGREAMVGAPAQALEEFQDSGHVRAFGEIWQARSDVPVGSGEQLEIIAIDELTLVVKPREED